MLVGDAAGFPCPLEAEGIWHAVTSGQDRRGDRRLGHLQGRRLREGAGRVRAALEGLGPGQGARVRRGVRQPLELLHLRPQAHGEADPTAARVLHAPPLLHRLRLGGRPHGLLQPAPGAPHGTGARVRRVRQDLHRPAGPGHLAQQRQDDPARRPKPKIPVLRRLSDENYFKVIAKLVQEAGPISWIRRPSRTRRCQGSLQSGRSDRMERDEASISSSWSSGSTPTRWVTSSPTTARSATAAACARWSVPSTSGR